MKESKISNGLTERDHKLQFLAVFRRWETLFKRADRGDVQAEKWLIAEYYDSLRHLSPQGLEALTRILKERCTFFPTIRECLEATKCGPYDWGHPFLNKPPHLFVSGADRKLLASPETQAEREARELFDRRFPPRQLSEADAEAMMPPAEFADWRKRMGLAA